MGVSNGLGAASVVELINWSPKSLDLGLHHTN